MSPGARDGGLPVFPSQSSVPSPRSGGPSRPLAGSQGLCLFQALGGMGEERTPGPIPLDSGRLVIPLVPTCEHRLLVTPQRLRAWSTLIHSPNWTRGTSKAPQRARSGVNRPCLHLRAESPLSLLLWPGLTRDLCGRMGLAGFLYLHLAWICQPLSWLWRTIITVTPRRVLAVTVTPRRSGPVVSFMWPLPSAWCS